MNKKIRNIAIIAHIDHGKTTLVDKLLQQSGIIKNNINYERIMDSNELEKERGITIFSKNTAIIWNGYRINIIDTPGHSDFGGEVERILSMVDAAVLIVDALEGPMPQTRFVTQKAFLNNLKIILVINKIDRPGARPDWVLNKTFDLFVNLKANDDQLDFPVIYTSAINGISGIDYKNMKKDMVPLLKTIINDVSPPKNNINKKLRMQISQLEYNNYLGTIGIGRIKSGKLYNNQPVIIINKEGKIRNANICKIISYLGLKRIEIENAYAGDIVAITGLGNLNISDTICDINNIKPIPPLLIEDPTITMFFNVNDSPFSGIEGNFITSRQILKRLKKETLTNVSLKVEETKDTNTFKVSGRGELHLSILIENMRREGFELSVSRPKIITKKINNIIKEPFENLLLDIKKKYQGVIIKSLGKRKGILKSIIPYTKEQIRLEYLISSRNLIGFRSDFITITNGSGLMHSAFSHYDNICNNEINKRSNGVLISNNKGKSLAFALFNLQNRGKLFINHGEKVYEGQIIGINSRSNDLTVNCITGKKLTNMRAAGSDDAITLITPIKITLEKAIQFIEDDELIEITPKSIRLRKKYLKDSERKRFNRIFKKK
ncbi:translational GTPase TypA [Enterobacteriaceae bacterium ET-AT1-13]|nr:translational GTPase TypA [Enterobacteriaceae bacterium ET-AT1-13]WGS66419.1 translational GTPase TypA [Enterobacteriaceae bacterium Cmel17]WMC17443.1 MAG: translational GTPase TypA [Enterobacteriaceae bacterium Cmel21]WMC18058.1 MAG: translational GTPase TypA [Enterobacteriaceae bacterium PSmelAO1]